MDNEKQFIPNFGMQEAVVVTGLPTKPQGMIVGIWFGKDSLPQYQVRCQDTTGRPYSDWWYASDLAACETIETQLV